MNTQDVQALRREMALVSHQVFSRGLTSATSGNLSARVPGESGLILIKRTGLCFGDVQPADFLLADLSGRVVEGEGQPSKELAFHLAIYRERPEVGAVLHGHSPYATAYVMAKGELPVLTLAAEYGLARVAIVAYAPPGSAELANLVGRAYGDPELKAAMLFNHGFITVGPDCRSAYYLADVLEDNARTAYLLHQLRRQ